jgi:hypothetical protein
MTTIQGFSISKDKKLSDNFKPYAEAAVSAKFQGLKPGSVAPKKEPEVVAPSKPAESVVSKVVNAVKKAVKK